MPTIFGKIDKPIRYEGLDDPSSGLIFFLTNVINFIIILAGIFTLVNFVSAGYGYLTGAGDPQKTANAGKKILQSLLGLVIVAAAFVIAALIGRILFDNTDALLNLLIFKFE